MYHNPFTVCSPSMESLNEQFSSYLTPFGLETRAVSIDLDFGMGFADGSRFIWDIQLPAPFEKTDNSVFNTSPLTKYNNETPTSVPGPMRSSIKCVYCNVCQKNITEEGKISQGPRLHILQHHPRRPLFFCPHCPATSNYQKGHIATHIKRIHPGLGGEVIVEDKNKYTEDYNRWFKRCFKSESESGATSKNQKTVQTNGQLDSYDGYNKENTVGYTPSFNPSRPLPFSIERILGL